MTDAATRVETTSIHPSTLRLLGGAAVLVETKRRAASRARGLVLKYRAVERLSAFLNASPPQLMRVIEINERTAQRRKEQGALTAEESDRLARVARVTQRAVDAIGDENQAREWLRRTNRALQGAIPLKLLGTDAGAERVADELGRIEYGDLY
jgi:putative toxin-antitoxin system antitoxin component (TIGR02293 family)